MRVYLAGSFLDRDFISRRRRILHEHDIECESEWIDIALTKTSGKTTEDEYTTEEKAYFALLDLADIDKSDVVVVNADLGGLTRGGMWFEAGYALAKGKVVILIEGDTTPIFKNIILRVNTWEECLGYLLNPHKVVYLPRAINL